MNNEVNHKEKVGTILIVTNITLVCLVLIFGTMVYRTKVAQVSDTTHEYRNSTAFNSITLDAKSVVVWDVIKGRIIFARDEKTPRPLASITKIMTAVTALSILPKNTTIIVKKDFLTEEGDSGLYVDEKWNLKNLLDFSLLVSSNDGMKSIASVAGAFNMPIPDYTIGRKDFIVKMNQVAKSIGLTSMYFNNETGLDTPDGKNGGVGSAIDATHLVEYALKKYPTMLEATKEKSEVIASFDKKHFAKNTDEVVTKIPNIIASKTGYTDLAGGNLVIAFDAGVGRPIIITVLGSTYTGRFTDMQKLASSTLAYIQTEE